MKKNKTIAYALAATLLVGGTFLGTKALFVDVDKSIGELAISTGDVDIEVKSEGWKLVRNGMELGDGSTVGGDTGEAGTPADGGDTNNTGVNPFANNLKPGDLLEKEITVTNIGTLKAKLELIKDNDKIKSQLGNLSGLIDASNTDVTIDDGNGDELLDSGEKASFKLTLKVKNQYAQHDKDWHNTNEIENQVVAIKDAWELIATQQDPRDVGFGQ